MSICNGCEHTIKDCLLCQVSDDKGSPLKILIEIAKVRNDCIDERDLYHSAMEESSEFAVECSKIIRGKQSNENLVLEMSDLLVNIFGIMDDREIAFEDLALPALYKTELRHKDQWAILNGKK